LLIYFLVFFFGDTLYLIRFFAKTIFIFSILLAISASVVRVYATQPFVQNQLMNYANVEQHVDLSKMQLQEVSITMSHYLSNTTDILDIRLNTSTDNIALFSPKEISHMRDVKEIILKIYNLQILSVLFLVLYVLFVYAWSREKALRDLLKDFRLAGIIGNAILLVCGILLYFSFDRYFVLFHEVAFTNDFWMLDPRKDLLIQLYPMKFWNLITVAYITTIVFINLSFVFVSSILLKYLKKN
jgi:integral membrane protein (TIGR01906 family)